MFFLQPYLIALVIGLLVGIEREKAHPTHKTMGVRTFVLISLLGAIAGGLETAWLASVVAAFALGLILISYFVQARPKAKDPDPGLTTEFAAGVMFCLGFMAHTSPAFSALMGPLLALILFSKTPLHRFTHQIKATELEAALVLLLGVVVVINLVPDAVVDPWGIFNPRKFAYLILTLATLEFSGYIAAKLIGEKKGTLVIGFLGGLASSTAVLLSSARQARKTPERWRTLFCSTVAAKLAALLEVLLIVGLVSPHLLQNIALPVGACFALGCAALVVVARRNKEGSSELVLKSPLDWRGVFRLAFLLGGILALISVAKLFLGESGAFAASFITGLFELHGVSLANATMYGHGKLSAEAATISIFIATCASLIAKICISWIIGRGIFARVLTMAFLLMIAVMVAVAFATKW